MNKILLALASAALVAGTLSAQPLQLAQPTHKLTTEKLKLQTNRELPGFNFQPGQAMTGVQSTFSQNLRASRATKTRDAKALTYLYPFDTYGQDDMILVPTSISYSQYSGYALGYASYYPTDVTKLFAGNKITSINFSCWYGVYAGAKAYILTEDSGTGSLKVVWSKDITVNDDGLTEVARDYTISGTESLIIGFGGQLTADSRDPYAASYGICSLLLPDETKSQNGGYLMLSSTDFSQFQPLGSFGVVSDENGSPLYAACPITAMTEGEAGLKPLDVVTTSTTPVRAAQVGGTTEHNIPVMNYGTSDIQTISYDVTLINQANQKVETAQGTYTLPEALPFLGLTYVPVSTILPKELGWGIDSLNITAVNGQADATPDDNVSGCLVYSLGDNAYKRKALVEEWTNTSCGYCPRGIIGMDALAEEYEQGNPEEETDVNVVTIHSSVYNPNDPLADASSEHGAYQYGISLPSAYINRVVSTDPFFGDNDASTAKEGIIATVAQYLSDNPVAEGKIGVASTYDEATHTLSISSLTNFATPVQQGEYSVGYYVTESALSATQTNYYSGQTSYNNTELQQLQTKGQTYTTDFNNVSRYCTNPQGYTVEERNGGIYLTGYYDAPGAQLPAINDSNLPIRHSAVVTLDESFDPNQANVVAVLYDNKTREVVNSASAWVGRTSTGIEKNTIAAPEAMVSVADGAFQVTADNAKAEVFGLDGKVVTSATVNGSTSLPVFGQGVYIIRVTANGQTYTKKAVF